MATIYTAGAACDRTMRRKLTWMPRASSLLTAGARDTGAPASGVLAGAGADGIGIRGSALTRSCLGMESSTVHSAGDSTLRVLYIVRRSTAAISTIRLTPPMFVPGDQDRTMRPIAPTLTVYTPVQERRAGHFTPEP